MRQSAAQRGRGSSDWRGALRVSDEDRDAVADRLAAAFADGRLDRDELEQRLDRALTATTGAQLSSCLDGLYRPPTAAPAVRLTWGERGWAFLVHVLGLVTSFVGPLLVLFGAGRRSAYVRAQAVEALNWQLSFLLANLVLVAATVFTLGLAALLWIPIVLLWPWFVLVAAVAAGLGAPLRPKRVLRLVR